MRQQPEQNKAFQYQTFYDLELADAVAELVTISELGDNDRLAELEEIKRDISALYRDVLHDEEAIAAESEPVPSTAAGQNQTYSAT